MQNDPIVIVGAARTPMGGFQGDFASLSASDLGAVAIKAAVERAGIAPGDVQEVLFGNCLMAGQGQAPARQAALKAGLPISVNCTTLSKMCGSAMKATMLAHDGLVAGSNDVVVAGGMESMTNAPYLMPKARAGYRMGHQQVYDHMFLDGLEDAYDKGRLMGSFAEDCAAKYTFTREAQDQFALKSLSRALAANNDGTFAWEIAPVTVPGRKGDVLIDKDEQPAKASPDKIPTIEAGVPQGRHGDGGQFELDLRWRRGVGADEAFGGRAARIEAAGGDRRARDARAGARVVLDGARRRHRKALCEDRLDARRTSTCSRSTRHSRS